MDIHQLNCLIAVAQHLNFTEAAKHLFIAQSAVSHNIAELEKELGVKLFDRNKHGISLTKAGEILLKDAFEITARAREATTKTHNLASGISGILKIGYVFEPIADKFSSNFYNFIKNYPNIELRFYSHDSITLGRLINSKELDVAFARHISIKNRDRQHWYHLYTDPLYLGVLPGHRLAEHKTISMNMIEDEPLILMNRGSNPGMFDMIVNLCMNKGYTPNVIDYTNDLLSQILMAKIGMGVVILPGQFLKCAHNDLVLIPIDDEDAYHEIGLVWSKENTNPTVPLLLKELSII